MRRQRLWCATGALIGLCGLLQACSTPTRSPVAERTTLEAPSTDWQGRLSVQVHSEPPGSMSAGFSLRGNAREGALDLYSPLGNTVGALQWSARSVQLSQGGSRQSFASLAELTEQTTGAALPIEAIFQWLQGSNASADGWQVDLSGIAQGLMTARRSSPLPEVSLRIKLD